MANGVVKWFDDLKGYGFISPEEGGGPDMFVHKSEVTKAKIVKLAQGARVSYDVANNAKTGRPAATNLQLIA